MPKNFWFTLLNWLLPEECLICGQAQASLCKNCLSQIPTLPIAVWPKLSGLDQVISATDYQILAKVIQAYKFQGVTNLAAPLAELLANYLNQQSLTIIEPLIIPLPSHPRRIRERGFDHIGLIAESFAKIMNWPLITNNLLRTTYTSHQVNLNRSERLKNLTSCFTIINPEALKNKTIILLDDVTTTGASLTEAAKTLKTGQPKTIIGLTLSYEK
ncbi:MAG: hypothetical protein NTV81_02190 [Candidatus Komeilibacteria bacterium]|nr:hypothetical protein [Candidatus Komeilibacteria bacterium]